MQERHDKLIMAARQLERGLIAPCEYRMQVAHYVAALLAHDEAEISAWTIYESSLAIEGRDVFSTK